MPEPATPTDDLSVEIMFWQAIQRDPNATAESYEAYATEFPTGRFIKLALIKINREKTRLSSMMDGAQIVELVSQNSGMAIKEMISTRRARRIAYVRFVAMAMMREFTTMSLPAIGKILGQRDHSGVVYGLRQIALMESGELKNPDSPTALKLLARVRNALTPSVTNGHGSSAASQP